MSATSETLSQPKRGKENPPLIGGVEMPQSTHRLLIKISNSILKAELVSTKTNFIIYLTALLLCIPMWWYTTSPYRAALPPYPESIAAKVNIVFAGNNNFKHGFWKNQQINDENLKINFDFSVRNDVKLDAFLSTEPGELFTVHAAALSDDELADIGKAGKLVDFYGLGIVVQASKATPEDVVDFLRRNWLELDKIDFLRSDNKLGDIWNDVTAFGAAHFELVFISNNWSLADANKKFRGIHDVANDVLRTLNTTLHVESSYQYVWDMQHVLELCIDRFAGFSCNLSTLQQIVSKIDRRILPTTSPRALFKIAFIYSNSSFTLVGSDRGQVLASWGSVITVKPSTTKSEAHRLVIESVLTLLGLAPATSDVPTEPFPGDSSWLSFTRRIFMANLLKACHAIQTIHRLADAMPDLVTTNELAARVADAGQLVSEALAKQSVKTAIRSRLVAESAVTDPTFNGRNELDASMKYGIYIPILLPMVFPILDTLFGFIKSSYKAHKSKKN